MQHEGPKLEILLRRLADTPQDFLDAPDTDGNGIVHVDALIFDLSCQIDAPLPAADLDAFCEPKADVNWLTLVAIACWLLADPALDGRVDRESLLHCTRQTLAELASEYAAGRYILDPERREELVRYVLADLDLLPAGETAEQAQDRLAALSSVERRRIIREAREAEKRAREIREALIKKAAAEAADKYTRE